MPDTLHKPSGGQLRQRLSLRSLRKTVSSLALSAISSLANSESTSASFSRNACASNVKWEEEPLMLPRTKSESDMGGSAGFMCVYYPARIGEELCASRYTILRKLGWGNYSTVWLARDTKESDYVALKILTTKATACHTARIIDEVALLNVIASADRAHPGYVHCISITDNFPLRSWRDDGKHLCLAFKEVLGMSVCELRRRRPSHTLSIASVKRVIRQLLLALDYLHETCRIIHTDLKPDSILVCLPNYEAVIKDVLDNVPPKMYPPRDFARDISSVASQPLPTPPDILDDASLNIKLIDFGHAQWINEHLSDQIQPPALRAPEVILGHPWGPGVDIWSLGCIIFELLTGQWLFNPKGGRSKQWSAEDQHLQQMMEHTGQRFSVDMLTNSSLGPRYFDIETGDLLRQNEYGYSVSIESALKRSKAVHESDIGTTCNFIRSCLVLDPAHRPSANVLFRDPWLR